MNKNLYQETLDDLTRSDCDPFSEQWNDRLYQWLPQIKQALELAAELYGCKKLYGIQSTYYTGSEHYKAINCLRFEKEETEKLLSNFREDDREVATIFIHPSNAKEKL